MKKHVCFVVCSLALGACTTKEAETPATPSSEGSSEGSSEAAWSMPGWSAENEGRSASPRSNAPATPATREAPRGVETEAAEADPTWHGARGATTTGSARATQPADADDTGVNERDRDPSRKTPMDQGNGATDLDLTQRIRQAVMADGGLSFGAKNVKIITSGGKVTLRGPVKSAAERSKIEAAARSIAGDANVVNQIEIEN